MNVAVSKSDEQGAVGHLSEQGRRSERYNNPLLWYDTINPPLFNRERFQRRVDDLTGLTERRQSKILLRWAWESSYEMFGRLRQRYCFLTLPIKGVPVEFSIPRWVMEERIEPEQIRESWESTRYVLDPATVVNDVDPGTGNVRKVIHAGDKIDKGECPREWFRNLWVIADHDGLCCEKADQMSRVCWGYYRHPDERDIKRVERIHAMKVRDDSFNQSPFEVLSPETLEASAKSAFEENRDNKERQSLELDARIDDFFNLHLDGFVNERPTPMSFGPETKRTPGGIYLPE
jgi:hypothetical protein